MLAEDDVMGHVRHTGRLKTGQSRRALHFAQLEGADDEGNSIRAACGGGCQPA